jgi:hypothetical protein
LVWRHADVRKIEPILQAAKQKPLGELDFLIEADNSDWKKYQIQPSLELPAFTTNDELKANMKAAYDSQYPAETLTNACGRKLDKDALESEVSRLLAEHKLEAEQEATADVFGATSGEIDITERTTEEDLGHVAMAEMSQIQSSDGDVNDLFM